MGRRKNGSVLSVLAVLFVLLPGCGSVSPAGGSVRVELAAPPPTVALTFDDGPQPRSTARLLDGLALREIPATFFLVGERIQGAEALVERMAREGHQLGIHSHTHRALTGLSGADFSAETDGARAALEGVLGPGDYWLRPPYGYLDEGVESRAGSPVILWSVDPEDWRDHDVRRIRNAVLSRVRDGDIILFHDIYDSSVEAALSVADALLDRGFCFATVEQLLAQRGLSTRPGQVIRCVPRR